MSNRLNIHALQDTAGAFECAITGFGGEIGRTCVASIRWAGGPHLDTGGDYPPPPARKVITQVSPVSGTPLK